MNSKAPLWLIVTGPSAAGKTTLVKRISQGLAIPAFEKDAIKDVLYRTLSFRDNDRSRRIGLSAINLLFATVTQMLRAGTSLVIEANFYRQFDSVRAAEILRNVDARGVQVQCSAPRRP